MLSKKIIMHCILTDGMNEGEEEYDHSEPVNSFVELKHSHLQSCLHYKSKQKKFYNNHQK